jgi:hypothetical protein
MLTDRDKLQQAGGPGGCGIHLTECLEGFITVENGNGLSHSSILIGAERFPLSVLLGFLLADCFQLGQELFIV